jgi:HEAT repeat protein
MAPIDDEDVALLVKRYTESSAAHARATEVGDHVAANLAHDALAEAYRELRRRRAQWVLLPLLEHPDLSVRVWAAAHALEFCPEQGEPVLKRAAEIPRGLVSFSAQMTLRQWHDGKLRFP